MATSSKHFCTLCLEDDISKEAEIWCPDCETVLCSDCTKHHSKNRASKNHRSTTVDNYQNLPPFILEMTNRCKDHDKMYDLFCTDHESACCVQCIGDQHNKCSNLVPLSAVLENIKSSANRFNVEKDVESLQQGFDKMTKYLTMKYTELQTQKTIAIDDARNFRKEIDKQLDKLEGKFVKDVSREYDSTLSDIQKYKDAIERGKYVTENLRKDLSMMIEFANDLQILGGIESIKKRAYDAFSVLDSLHTACNQIKLCIKIELSPSLKTEINGLASFGKISVVEEKTPLDIRLRDEGNIQIPVSPKRDIESIKPKLKHKIKIGRQNINLNITGCLIMPDSKMLVIDRNSRKLILMDDGGTFLKDVVTFNASPWNLCMISETKVAVTFVDAKKVMLVDISMNRVVKSIDIENVSHGIDSIDGKTLTITTDEKASGPFYILTIDTDGSEICKNQIRENTTSIALFKNRIYVADYRYNEAVCYNTKGEIIWTYQHNDMRGQRGLTLDESGNVYAACSVSNNIVVLSQDRKEHRVILSHQDGLNKPFALHFDKRLSRLLVCNFDDGKAFLYQC